MTSNKGYGNDLTEDSNRKSQRRHRSDEVVYEFDISSNSFKCAEYLSNRFRYHKISKRYKKVGFTRHPRYDNSFSMAIFDSVRYLSSTTVDSIKGGMIMVSSGWLPAIFIEIITDSDTVILHKTIPYEWNTPWTSSVGTFTAIVNPKLDNLIATLLPINFALRPRLLLVEPKAKE